MEGVYVGDISDARCIYFPLRSIALEIVSSYFIFIFHPFNEDQQKLISLRKIVCLFRISCVLLSTGDFSIHLAHFVTEIIISFRYRISVFEPK